MSIERESEKIIEMAVGEDGTEEFQLQILAAVKAYYRSGALDRAVKLSDVLDEIHDSAIVTFGQIQGEEEGLDDFSDEERSA